MWYRSNVQVSCNACEDVSKCQQLSLSQTITGKRHFWAPSHGIIFIYFVLYVGLANLSIFCFNQIRPNFFLSFCHEYSYKQLIPTFRSHYQPLRLFFCCWSVYRQQGVTARILLRSERGKHQTDGPTSRGASQ